MVDFQEQGEIPHENTFLAQLIENITPTKGGILHSYQWIKVSFKGNTQVSRHLNQINNEMIMDGKSVNDKAIISV